MAEHKIIFVEPPAGCEERRRSKRMMACPSGHRYCCSEIPETPRKAVRKSPKKIGAGSPPSPTKIRNSPRSRTAGPVTRKIKRRNLAEIYEITPACELPKEDEEEDEDEDDEEDDYEEVDDVKCGNCDRGNDPQRFLLCDGCDRGYHMYCLSPILVAVPKGDWFCPHCSKDRQQVKVFPMVQRKLIDFFGIEKVEEEPTKVRRRRHSGSLVIYKKSRKLLPYMPSKDPSQRLEQMASLASALMTSGIEFSNELTYLPGLAPRRANRAVLEKGGMQVIGKEDKATYELCKAMCIRGEHPPLMVTRDPRQGFVVEANNHIKDMTLIAEYTGDVDFMCNREDDEGDSIMGLLFPEDASQELVICPDKRGNIARFISGINNHTSDGRKKQNLRCIRFDIDGEVHALLVSIRDIAKGERLYYDYNAYQKEYPTEHFE
ncbi:histone-lysine N-methyltransferase ATXR6 isoform X2 [Selaginella moellendorffii]|uniref:histone-lysine N-methyltransferase ATXR6 isoform X2 n=1 Tax=Selaginella moellendorffii TaxID=88036 RepID=UPI000D1CAD59|nr:histone-lysine N-methyltransferase ATXR6 isoform X2 [Selaginella moellendorffii]|eukprot:XP_024528998.1 histone-lysine N-methyltransferase ATXR6 isoform X2 [Selaginella moellendorffii]